MVRPELDDTATMAGTPAAIAAAETGALVAGARLGHFRIENKLGAGGMGEVYLATDLALDRPVAIKVLPAGSSSGAAHDRLVREARAQARVQHGNVAHIYYIGEDGGRLYFAMEYIAGGSLADAVAKGPLALDDALAVVHAAALGLREAQAQGFLHRDVKPSNLMRDAHGTVKVVDFGLAQGGDPAALEDGPVQQTTLAGTPLYMAPEQARGDAIDLRADIYALGATLYHLVSGKPPFQAASTAELVTLHRSARRPVLSRKGRGAMSVAAIDALVAKMMAPEPKDRFASYDELVRAIELASAHHTRPAGIWVRGIAWLVDLILVMIVLGLFAEAVAIALVDSDRSVDISTWLLPALALVQTLAYARWGTTPGKALFELEVIQLETGRRPRLPTALAREAVLYGAVIVGKLGADLAHVLGAGSLVELVLKTVDLLAYGAIGLALVHASLRVPGKRTPWDRVSDTMVRYRASRRA
ncbi:MAG TPA: protein kinase [Kofleriaceae bacterium]|nr:protein kinase [Kofleriaceae bacterium]